MKKFSLIALAGVCSLGLLSACSDDSTPDPTRAELCANGISDDCLNGAWNANGMANKASGEMHSMFNYTAAPGTLTFDKNTHEFQFDAPALAADIATADCNPVYGEWSIAAGVLHMRSFTNTMCMGPKTVELAATVALDETGTLVNLNLGQLYFMYNLTDEMAIKNSYTESFSALAK